MLVRASLFLLLCLGVVNSKVTATSMPPFLRTVQTQCGVCEYRQDTEAVSFMADEQLENMLFNAKIQNQAALNLIVDDNSNGDATDFATSCIETFQSNNNGLLACLVKLTEGDFDENEIIQIVPLFVEATSGLFGTIAGILEKTDVADNVLLEVYRHIDANATIGLAQATDIARMSIQTTVQQNISIGKRVSDILNVVGASTIENKPTIFAAYEAAVRILAVNKKSKVSDGTAFTLDLGSAIRLNCPSGIGTPDKTITVEAAVYNCEDVSDGNRVSCFSGQKIAEVYQHILPKPCMLSWPCPSGVTACVKASSVIGGKSGVRPEGDLHTVNCIIDNNRCYYTSKTWSVISSTTKEQPIDDVVAQRDVLDVMGGLIEASSMLELMGKASLISFLQGDGPFTIFVAQNDAILKSIINADSSTTVIRDIVMNHIVAGKIELDDKTEKMVETLSGHDYRYEIKQAGTSQENLMLNDVSIGSPLHATNGVIYIMDQILIPSEYTDAESGFDASAFGVPTYRAPPRETDCTNTDGSDTEIDGCVCGTIQICKGYCERKFGIGDVCHEFPKCQFKDGSVANNLGMKCLCSWLTCNEGQFCNTFYNRCSDSKDDAQSNGNNPIHPAATGFIAHIDSDIYRELSKKWELTHKIVRRKIANGLRASFPRIRELTTAFKDDEGFVRTGLTFCGYEMKDGVIFDIPSDFSRNTPSLSSNDGWSFQNETKNQCGHANCMEGSFVQTLARYIRSHGYHIRHDDICNAFATVPAVVSARTCNLQNNVHDRTAWKCNADSYENQDDWWQVNKVCYGLSKLDCNSQGKCAFDEVEEFCRASDIYMDTVCLPRDDSETFFSSTLKNEVWTVLGFSVNEDPIPKTQKSYVTGAISGQCTSVRAILSAINGNAQLNSFRDIALEEAAAHWKNEITGVRSYLVALSKLLTHFYEISMTMFPYIENEEIKDCPMGEVRHIPQIETGTKEAPLCENVVRQSSVSLNRINEVGQAMTRHTCFCRNGELDPNYETITPHYDVHEFDQIYLSLGEKKFECDTFADTLPSIYTYCRNIQNWGDTGSWKKSMELIQVREERIKIYSSDSRQKFAKTRDIMANLKRTLPKHEVTCGRVVTANSDEEQMFSNKGGNCVPFEKLHEVFYRLEYETSKAESGKTILSGNQERSGSSVKKTATKFDEFFCDDAHTHSNTKFSFRQMAYLWDHYQGGSASDPTVTSFDKIFTFQPKEVSLLPPFWSSVENTRGAFPDSQRYSLEDRDFCFVDWIGDFSGSSTRIDAFGDKYLNPYELYGREIDEAVWNTDIALSAKKRTKIDNLELWDVLEDQLTNVEDSNILSSIAEAAARHYMRVTTTDIAGEGDSSFLVEEMLKEIWKSKTTRI